MINAMRAWIQKRRRKISNIRNPMQGLIDAESKRFPAAYNEPRDFYRKLSEVPQGVNHG
jgi:hypothetical protein